MADLRVGALIPAAGLSTRMHAFKPLLQIAGKTVLEHAVELFERTGIQEIITVVGHRSDELIPVVERTRSRWVLNHGFQDGMFSSIQRGVHALRKSCDAFFLLPVDILFVRPSTIHMLLDAFQRDTSVLVCYPQFNAQRGHPPLIDTCLADEILAFSGKGGMREFLRKYEKQAGMVPVDDASILMDVDTPEDFSVIQKTHEKHLNP
jgi:CTP:molybdopterin cytidylyltransferase MocA